MQTLNRLLIPIFYRLFLITLIFLYACKEETIEPEFYGHVKGQVIDGESNQAVSHVNITTDPPTTSLLTSDSGDFKLIKVPAGDYVLRAQKNNYSDESVSIKVLKNDTTNVVIVMEKKNPGSSHPIFDQTYAPPHFSTGHPTDLILKWKAIDNDRNDTLVYTVSVYESGKTNPFFEASNLTDTSIFIKDLSYSTTYYWQLKVTDSHGNVSHSELLSFSTKNYPLMEYAFSAPTDNNDMEIIITDSLATDYIYLTNNAHSDLSPKFDPREEFISYISDQSGSFHIYVADVTSFDSKKITSVPLAGYNNKGSGYDWSPDGSFIIYPYYNNIVRITRDGVNPAYISTITESRNFKHLSYSPDGTQIVALTAGPHPYQGQILLLNSNGAIEDTIVTDLPGIIDYPSFTPDGNGIIYTRDISGFESDLERQLNTHIFRVNLDGTELTDLSLEKPQGTNDLYPSFSGSGGEIIFANAPSNKMEESKIYTMTPEGMKRTFLFPEGKYPERR